MIHGAMDKGLGPPSMGGKVQILLLPFCPHGGQPT